MESNDQRHSLRIRDRAQRLLYSNNYYGNRSIPYHKRLCTFGLSVQLPPVDSNIYLARQPDTDLVKSMAEDARFGVIDTTINGLKDNVGSLQDDMGALSDDVRNIRTEMGDIGGKLDRLISAMSLQSSPSAPALPDQVLEQNQEQTSTKQQHQHAPTAHPSHIGQSNSRDRHPNPRQFQGQQSGHSAQHGRQHHANGQHTTTDNQASAGASQANASTGHSNALPPHLTHQMSEDQFLECEMSRDQFKFPNSGKNCYVNDFNASRIISKPYMYKFI